MKEREQMMNCLHIDDAEWNRPKQCQGDLFIDQQAMAFIVYTQGNTGSLAALLFGVIGFIVRSHRMNKWRDTLRGKSMDQMIEENDGSWKLSKQAIKCWKLKFPAKLLIETVNGENYRLSVPRFPDFKEYIRKNDWPELT
jgi:predicted RNA-binding protein (virulence factor B family)